MPNNKIVRVIDYNVYFKSTIIPTINILLSDGITWIDIPVANSGELAAVVGMLNGPSPVGYHIEKKYLVVSRATNTQNVILPKEQPFI